MYKTESIFVIKLKILDGREVLKKNKKVFFLTPSRLIQLWYRLPVIGPLWNRAYVIGRSTAMEIGLSYYRPYLPFSGKWLLSSISSSSRPGLKLLSSILYCTSLPGQATGCCRPVIVELFFFQTKTEAIFVHTSLPGTVNVYGRPIIVMSSSISSFFRPRLRLLLSY